MSNAFQPPAGDKISISNGKLTVPNNPVIPFIRGDGTGPDIWAASVRVFDAAVAEGLRRQPQDLLVRGLRGRGRQEQIRQLAARRHRRGVQGISSSASKARSPRRSAAASAR